MSTHQDFESSAVAQLVKRRERKAWANGFAAGIAAGIFIGLCIFLFVAAKNGRI